MIDYANMMCNICNYTTDRKSNFIRHLHSKKHKEMNTQKFVCNICNMTTNRKANYKRHLKSSSHLLRKENPKNTYLHDSLINIEHLHSCEICGKKYKYLSGLSKHKLRCCPSMFKHFEKRFTEQRYILQEHTKQLSNQTDKLTEIALQPNNQIIYAQNNTNKTLNIETYLNIECKDAINMSDFINQIKLSFKDAVFMGKNGFAKAFQTHVIDEIQRMDKTKRPLHCTNKRQELLYIKDKNVWAKDKDHELFKRYMSCFRDKELREIYNKSISGENYETDREVVERMDALNVVANALQPSIQEKIIRQTANQLYLGKNDIITNHNT